MSRRIEIEASDEVLKVIDRLGQRWGEKIRTKIIERAVITAEDALAHAEQHPAWTPPDLRGNRYLWRSGPR
ncbi:MAG TPA: hypothetical protein VF453_09485 [Burkholderiaceae bacterium]